MYAACLLLKKGLLLNQEAIAGLKNKKNTFELKDFEEFANTEECKKIKDNYQDDEKIYLTFSD